MPSAAPPRRTFGCGRVARKNREPGGTCPCPPRRDSGRYGRHSLERLTAPFSPGRAAARNEPHSPHCFFPPPLRKLGVRGDRCLLAPKTLPNHYMQSPLCPPRALTLILEFNLERNTDPTQAPRGQTPVAAGASFWEEKRAKTGAGCSARRWERGSAIRNGPERSAPFLLRSNDNTTVRRGGRGDGGLRGGGGGRGAFRTQLNKHIDRNSADNFFTGTITGKTK